MTSNNQHSEKDRASGWKILTVVLAYWTISISMVFSNKFLVGSGKSNLDISLFVAWVQCVVTSFFVLCIRWYKRTFKHCRKEKEEETPIIPTMLMHRRVLLMTCSFVGMLSFNNLCLRHVGVAFYQVARSMTLIFVVILSIVMLRKKVSIQVFTCCFVVAGGFGLATDQESLAGTLSVQGSIYGIIASSLVALNGIFTKKALDVVNRDSVLLTFYTNADAVLVFFPIIAMTGQLQSAFLSDQLYSVKFWTFLCASGLLSFAIAWISAVQIDLTSPVTHHISANAKSVLQTVIAVIYYKEQKSPMWWFSIFLVVGGATSYALIRIQEEEEARAQRESLQEIENVDKGSRISVA